MKKTLLLLTGLLILLSGAFYAVPGQEAADPIVLENTEQDTVSEAAEDSAERIVYDYDELVIAGVTPTTGNFFCSLWGSVTSDIDVQMLVHGYNLVEWETEEGMFIIDPTVVSGIIVTEDQQGNRTYTLALYNDLYYSDGTRITARDYAFSMLLTMSNEAAAIGGNVKRPEYLLGYSEYINGDVPYLAGVRILADDQFSITVSAEYLPFFYELGLLDCIPYPISVIAPGVMVADDGNGVYLTSADGSGSDLFTAELLEKTILDEAAGYLTHPAVSSGPYTLTSYENGVVEFELNPYYKGDVHGMQPRIERLTYLSLTNDELIAALTDGSVGLVHKVTDADTVQNGLITIGAHSQLTMSNYPRTGLSFISFNTERTAVDDPLVRRAIAFAMDKDAFVAETVSGYGLRTEGYYGIGQWMYQLLNGTLAYPIEEDDPEYDAKMEEWEDLSLDEIETITQDPDEAAALLSRAGWNLNSDGSAYQSGAVRYKNIGGQTVPLSLTLAYPEGTSAADALVNLAASLSEVGIDLQVYSLPMEELIGQYYGVSEREYDMFFLASNFDAIFDPSANFVLNENGEHVWVTNGVADEDLYQFAVNMRKTEAGDLIGYCREWLNFQIRFAEVLPMIPLYSNVYFDFYPNELQNYDITSYLTWSQAVIPAYMSDVIDTVEDMDELNEGEFELLDFEEFE